MTFLTKLYCHCCCCEQQRQHSFNKKHCFPKMLSNENSFWEFSAFCPFNDSIGFQRIYVSLFREILRNNRLYERTVVVVAKLAEQLLGRAVEWQYSCLAVQLLGSTVAWQYSCLHTTQTHGSNPINANCEKNFVPFYRKVQNEATNAQLTTAFEVTNSSNIDCRGLFCKNLNYFATVADGSPVSCQLLVILCFVE